MELVIPVAAMLATMYVLIRIAFAGGSVPDHDIRNTDLRRPV